MKTSDAILMAFRQSLDEQLLGIEQVDAVLCEDGAAIILYGHTSDPDVTFTASLPVPAALEWSRI
ncbi:hypothetical protein [Aquicoccus sp. SU-CL01552]|uniref:hypothetical protein n=1 Tax=Aquicoccus sp. SU-CL01552 TaxID=3127656 RepID=UPI003101E0F6